MQGMITFEFVATVSVIVGVVFGVWWRIESRIKQVEAQVSSLRIEMIKDYASVSHLKEVEGRLIGALDRLTDEVSKLRAAWVSVPSQPVVRTRKTQG
jgi:uncharacterized membrane protein YqgA involved in biofilm formation